MKRIHKLLLLVAVLTIGSTINAQNISVRGVGVSIWNVNGKTPSPNQMIYPLAIGIKFEDRSAYNTLGERHFWVDRNDKISNKDYATTPRPERNGLQNASLDQISVDERTTLLIAVPLSNMNVAGWTRVPGAFRTSIRTMYTYEYNYTTPNRWIDVPYFDKNTPTIIFGDRGKIKFDNPISIASQSEGVIIEDKNMPYNRKDSSRGVRAFYSYDPNLLVLPNGKYIAGRNGARFISSDKGKTWSRLEGYSDIDHATVFSHNGDLYLIGDEKGSSNHKTLIARSTDEGKSWSNSVELGFIGRNSPSPVVEGNGRLWIALEDKPSANVIMASASVNSNLMNPRSWSITRRPDNPRDYTRDDNEPYIARGRNGYPIAFSINEGPVQATSATSAREIIRSSDFNLPSKGSKSDIKYDPVTDKYWALTSASTVPGTRAGVTLFSSTDLRTWKKEREPIKASAPEFHGFSYAFMQFDGDDIVFACRTAWENQWGLPQRWHDSNMLTFHRIRNFRGGSSTRCSVVPYININNEGWNSVRTVTVEEGNEVWFGPQSERYGADGGNWTWMGPNGFTSSGRSLRLRNVQPNQVGTYTATNRDQSGCTSSLEFSIQIEGVKVCSIVPYINVNNEGWESVSTAEVEIGDEVWFGPQSDEFGANGENWTWSGPNQFTYSGRSLRIRNIQQNQAGIYTATNVDQNGCSTDHRFTISIPLSTLEGTYHIRNVKTGEYLDSDDGGVVGQVRNPSGRDKIWNLTTSTNGYYFIDNSMSDRGPLAASPSQGSIKYLAERYNNSAYVNREWQAIVVSGNTYKFLCKDADRGYITAIGRDVVENRLDGDDSAAHWQLIPISNKVPNLNENGISITPVPNNGRFSIHFNNNKITNVTIYSITGSKVFSKSFGVEGFSSNTLDIDSGFIPGVYLVRAMDANGHNHTSKLIIQ